MGDMLYQAFPDSLDEEEIAIPPLLNDWAKEHLGLQWPIELRWDGAVVMGYDDDQDAGGYQSYLYDSEDYEIVRHIIGLDPRKDDASCARSLRHELEHSRQLELLGVVAYWSSYAMELDGRDESNYHLNVYEIEANDAMNREWHKLLPLIERLRP